MPLKAHRPALGEAMHIGRGGIHEDRCPCPQEPCGLVSDNRIDPACPKHSVFKRGKIIRYMHWESSCPEREGTWPPKEWPQP